jgi:hypothetical protein
MRDVILNLLMKLKAPGKWIAPLAVIIAAICYITNPLGKSYIRVPGNHLVFEIPSFKSCEIRFREPLSIQQCNVTAGPNISKSTEPQTARVINISRTTDVVVVENPYTEAKPVASVYTLEVYAGHLLV